MEENSEKPLTSVSVFCGSSYGKNQNIVQAIKYLGIILGQNANLIRYGGGLYGHLLDLMKAVGQTDAKMEAIIPPAYYDPKEQYPDHVTVIESQNDEDRIDLFLQSDAFVVTPGGDGTIAEAFFSHNRNLSALFNKQHNNRKPVVFLNTDNFYQHLIAHFRHMIEQGYSNSDRQAHLHFAKTPQQAINLLRME